jgi:hypothetical protein
MFSIPATSASSEQEFSVGGRVITSTRTRMSIGRMSKIMRTKLNMDRVPAMKWDFLDDPTDTPQLSCSTSTASTVTIASTSSGSQMPPPSGSLRWTETSVSQWDSSELVDDDNDKDFDDYVEGEEDKIDEN